MAAYKEFFDKGEDVPRNWGFDSRAALGGLDAYKANYDRIRWDDGVVASVEDTVPYFMSGLVDA